MKIRRIRLENINSLRGEHEISFSDGPLAQSRLFAITGPTGSGKSTLLDVITLALYNQIPRLNSKITKNLILSTGAILTQNTKKALAEVEYECATGVFVSRWSIEFNRNDNLKDYEMEIATMGGELLPLKRSEVPDKNRELIGLSYEQFIKSILLAQGAFAEFLKARKSERGELLEKITGTGIYRQLGIKAFERKKEFAEKLENLHQRRQEWEGQKPDDEKVSETRRAKNRLEKEIRSLEKTLDETSRNQENKKSIAKLSIDYNEVEKSLKGSKEKFAEYEAKYGKQLTEHQRTVGFALELHELDQLEREEKRLADEVLLEENRLNDQRQRKTALLEEVEKLMGKKPEEEGVREHLKGFRSKVLNIQEKRSELRRQYQFEKDRLSELMPELRLGNSEDLSALKNRMETQLEEFDSERKAIQSKLKLPSMDDLESIKEETEQKSRSVYNASGIVQNYRDRKSLVEQEWKKREELAKKLAALPAELKKAESQLKEVQLEVENLELKIANHRLVAELEEYRHKLKTGEPCPLCGSVEHPYSAHQQPAGVLQDLEKELGEKKKQRTELESKVREWSQSINSSKEELNRLDEQIEEHEKLIVETKTKLDELYADWTSIDNWEELKSDFENRLKSLKRLQDIELGYSRTEKSIQIIEKMMGITLQGKEVKDKLESIYKGEDIESEVDGLSSRWQSIKEAIAAGNSRIDTYRKQIKQIDISATQRRNKLVRMVVENGFENLKEARAARMGEEQYARIKSGRDALEAVVKDEETQLLTLKKTLEELKTKVSTEESLEELDQKYANIQSELAARRKNLQEQEVTLNLRKQCEEQIERLDGEIAREGKTARKWQLLNKLIGDATGNKFNQFAQDLTLDQLLILGNQRLKGLSDRYRMARPKGEEDEALVIIDNHMAGMRRSVRTLSGGETFLISLSLALALSDLASRKVEINSLFVDEGFGTLDPETLDQTLDTLEKLQAEGNKTIGIISHVEALKERIATQIQLERNSLGNSSMRIVG